MPIVAAGRELVDIMGSQVGERFSALVAGMAAYGLFVCLPNTTEGLVLIDFLEA